MECQKHKDIQIKSEHVPLYKDTIDLTQDNDAIEPEVDRIADSISANIHGALKYTLQPFVRQYNNKCSQHSVISGVLRQLPEFQKLVSENAELKMEINNLKKEFQTNDKITLEVREKSCSENDHTSMGSVNEFYKEIKNLEDVDVALSYRAQHEVFDTLEPSDEDDILHGNDEAEGGEEDDEDEVEKVEEEDEGEEESADGSEEELYIVEMELDGKDIQYYTNDDENGEIYTILEEDEVGPQVGVFKDGDPIFS